MLPWEKRKRRCGNCRYWETPEPPYMGLCMASAEPNPFMVGPRLSIKIEGQRTTNLPVQTAEFHVCGMWTKKEQAS